LQLPQREKRADSKPHSPSPNRQTKPNQTPLNNRYLQSQRDVRPAVIMAASTTAAAPFLFSFLVMQSGMGLDGAALAFVISNAATLIGLSAFVVARAKRLAGDAKQTWTGFSKEAFSGWGEYLQYGVPAAAHICLEWWAMEIIILWAGERADGWMCSGWCAVLGGSSVDGRGESLGVWERGLSSPAPRLPWSLDPRATLAPSLKPHQQRTHTHTHSSHPTPQPGLLPDAKLTLSTMGLCLSINAYLYMLPLGLASSINTNIANALGGGDGARARSVFLSGMGLSLGLQTALVAGLLTG